MYRGAQHQTDAESVPLQLAFLCVDCESVSSPRCDECPVCGSRSLLSLAGIVGGTLLDYKATRLGKQNLLLFDLDITIELKQMEGRDLSAAIEGITSVIGPKLGRGRASLHINVEPVGTIRKLGEAKAA